MKNLYGVCGGSFIATTVIGNDWDNSSNNFNLHIKLFYIKMSDIKTSNIKTFCIKTFCIKTLNIKTFNIKKI